MTRTRFHALIEQQLIQLDGATGTELVKRGMPAGVCPSGGLPILPLREHFF